MRVTIVIAAGALLVVVGLAVYHHLQKPVPAVSQEQVEPTAAASPPRPRLPAPRVSVASPPAEPAEETAPTTNIIARLINGDLPRVSAEQLEPYLQKHHRSVGSLLGAFAATGDRAFLREALEKIPNDPHLNLIAYYQGDAQAAEVAAEGHDRNQPATAERRQLLDTLANAAPDNALPNYLAALDCFKAGQTDQAVAQLVAASQKSKFRDYSLEYIQNAEEAYRAAGYSEGDAKAVANSSVPLPHLAELKQAGYKLVELAALYRQAGDEASAQAAEQIGLGLGQRLTEPGQLSIMQELAGIAIERKILGAMDPNSVLAGTGETVQSRLDAFKERQKVVRALAGASDILQTLPESDLANYFDRIKIFGETAAAEWLLKTHGK